MFDPLLKT